MTLLQQLKVEILQEARDRLKAGRNYSVCGAINNHAQTLGWDGRDIWDEAEYLLTYIREALRPESFSLKDWVEVFRPDLPRDKESILGYRLAWIDWMIFCLENPDLPPPEPKGNTV